MLVKSVAGQTRKGQPLSWIAEQGSWQDYHGPRQSKPITVTMLKKIGVLSRDWEKWAYLRFGRGMKNYRVYLITRLVYATPVIYVRTGDAGRRVML